MRKVIELHCKHCQHCWTARAEISDEEVVLAKDATRCPMCERTELRGEPPVLFFAMDVGGGP
jgi:hypothetical protein